MLHWAKKISILLFVCEFINITSNTKSLWANTSKRDKLYNACGTPVNQINGKPVVKFENCIC